MDQTPEVPQTVAAGTGSFPGGGGGEALPRAPVLAYLTGISTPTRARKVAATGSLVVALGALLLAAVMAGMTLWQIHGVAAENSRPAPPAMTDYKEAVQEFDYTQFYPYSYYSNSEHFAIVFTLRYTHVFGFVGRVIVTSILLLPGLGLVVLALAVKRGRPGPCRLAVGMLVPLILLVFPLILIPACAAVTFGMGNGPERSALWGLLVLPPGILLIVLLKDLCAYLLWIARNPMVDKPAVPFVGKSGGLP